MPPVYRAREQFPVDPAVFGLRMEPVTHQWYSEDGDLPDPIKSAGTEAIHRRLGNLTSVKALHDDAACRLPPASTILRLVLYDGYHAGDVIAPERMDELQEELVALRRGAPISILFASFLELFGSLGGRIDEQSNPIVFV